MWKTVSGSISARIASLRAFRPHPVTGDMLSPGEQLTWHLMRVYRSPVVFLGLQLLTAVWWLFPRIFPGGLPAWNYVWSDLAVVVEMIVGMCFLGQSLRDAVVIRHALEELKAEVILQREELELLHEVHAAIVKAPALDKDAAV